MYCSCYHPEAMYTTGDNTLFIAVANTQLLEPADVWRDIMHQNITILKANFEYCTQKFECHAKLLISACICFKL